MTIRHTHTHHPFFSLLLSALLSTGLGVAGLSGCSLADQALLDQLRDAGSNIGEPNAANTCGVTDGPRINGATQNIVIDTRSLSNNVSSLVGECGIDTPGNDGFLAVDVVEGEYWHFHLRVDTTPGVNPDPTALNPILYVLSDTCSPTACRKDLLANFCSENQDEHFGIEFRTTGKFYIGIDDGNAGGGVYVLDALKPTCTGTGSTEHGENCDGDPTRCSDKCRGILDDTSENEFGFNFNFVESNEIFLGASKTGQLTIEGNIGGSSGCKYPDVFAVDVPGNATLTVKSLTTTSNDCLGTGLLRLDLQDALGSSPANSVDTNSEGCHEISRTFPPEGGVNFIVVNDGRGDAPTLLPYRLDIEVVP